MRCEGLPLGEPAQARRVTTMWQSQPIIIMYTTHPPSQEGEFLLQAPFGKGTPVGGMSEGQGGEPLPARRLSSNED